MLHLPAGHCPGVWVPAGQEEPAGHVAVQDAVVSPVVCPYLPALHGEQAEAPAALHVPAAQMAAVAEVLPATHRYPAVHWPVQAALVSPDVAP